MIEPAVLGIDLQTWGGIALGAATIIGGAAALLVVAEALRRWYRRTLGRRQDRYERLGRLGAGARLSFFEAVLGEPPAMSNSFVAALPVYDRDSQQMVPQEQPFRQHFFIDRDYYIQAFCNLEETVLAFSGTARSRRFNPTFSFPPDPGWRGRRRWKKRTGHKFRQNFRVKLGRTRFSALDGEHYRPLCKAESGARTYAYTEALYLGNPGYYQHYCFTASVAAYWAPVGQVAEVRERFGPDWFGGLLEEEPERVKEEEILRRFRAQTVITTFTVLGPNLQPQHYPTTFGPHGDEVRTLP